MSQTNVQTTSIQAYNELDDLSARQGDVLTAIRRMGTACNQAIADHLGMPVNQVTGRVFELRKKGLVISSHKAIWPATGKNVIWWAEAVAAAA